VLSARGILYTDAVKKNGNEETIGTLPISRSFPTPLISVAHPPTWSPHELWNQSLWALASEKWWDTNWPAIYIYIWSAKQPWFLAVSGNAQEIHGFLTKDKKCGLKRRKPNSAWRSFRSNWALARSGTLKFDGGTPATMANYGTMGSKWDIWLDVGFFCLIQLESQGIWETSRVGEWHSHLFLGSLFGKDNRWNAELAAAHFLCFRNLTEVVLELVRHDLNMHFMQATTRITWLYVLTGVQVDMQIIFRVMIGVWFVPSCFEPVCVLESLKDWWRKEWLASIGPIVEAMSSMCAFEMEAFSEQATRTVDEWLLVVCFRLLFIVPPVSRSNHIGHPMTQYNY